VEGDYQADREHHGGPDQTLCLYSLEVLEMLQGRDIRLRPDPPGRT
jgi:MOSC domain-containing protein YiiM